MTVMKFVTMTYYLLQRRVRIYNIGIAFMNQQTDILRFIEWAFTQGYNLGVNDAKEDIYIDSEALMESFLNNIAPQTK